MGDVKLPNVYSNPKYLLQFNKTVRDSLVAIIVRRGDRVEIFNSPDTREWYSYRP